MNCLGCNVEPVAKGRRFFCCDGCVERFWSAYGAMKPEERECVQDKVLSQSCKDACAAVKKPIKCGDTSHVQRLLNSICNWKEE